jgi:hypothetical protein
MNENKSLTSTLTIGDSADGVNRRKK